MHRVSIPRFARYVAIGDSSTEGLDDPDERGGYRGWANRLAEQVAATSPGLQYANLAIRGRATRRVRDEQLAPALAMRPDLATVFVGTNDVLRRRFAHQEFARDLLAMQGELRSAGATVLSFTLPDLSDVIPGARLLRARVLAMNDVLREVSARTGSILVDFAAHPVASDLRLWSDDRLHANAEGHRRIAAALAEALGLPGADAHWRAPLPAARMGRRERLRSNLAWARLHLLPWAWRHLRGRSSGDGIAPKRPQLSPL